MSLRSLALGGLSIALGSVSLANGALTFESQNRFAEVYTTPTFNLGKLRAAANSLGGATLSSRRRTSDASSEGFGHATQVSKVSNNLSVVGGVTATALGDGAGHAQSYFTMSFRSDVDSPFWFDVHAAATATSTVSLFRLRIAGDGVNFLSDSLSLGIGESYNLSGGGVFRAAKLYTVEIDLVAEATGTSAPGGGSYDFALIPTPGTAALFAFGSLPLIRKRR